MTGSWTTDWWQQDLSDWPGPHEQPDLSLVVGMEHFTAMARAYGKTLHQAMETMEAIGIGLSVYGTVQTETASVSSTETIFPPKGPPKHVGPRSKRQFDHRGRRLF